MRLSSRIRKAMRTGGRIAIFSAVLVIAQLCVIHPAGAQSATPDHSVCAPDTAICQSVPVDLKDDSAAQDLGGLDEPKIATRLDESTSPAYGPTMQALPAPISGIISPLIIAPGVYSVTVQATRAPECVIDQDQAGKGGPPQYWHRIGGYGVDGDMTWTYVNGSTTCNWMVWRSGMGAGRYQVFAFIPRNYATTRNAVYWIENYYGNTWNCINKVSVNQYNCCDVWVNLGTYNFAGEPSVYLDDNTGESYNATKRMVGFDAIKFVRIDSAPPQAPPVASRLQTALNRAHSDLGWNRVGKRYYCLRYMMDWWSVPGKYYSAELSRQNYVRKGKFRAGGSPASAPLGAWLYFRWGSNGHIGMRCEHGLIHQDNSSTGRGRVAHATGFSIGLTYLGYVTWEDAVNNW